MIIEQTTALGQDALDNPGKYRGFMGVSILHKFFAPKRMKYFLKWGSETFEDFVILLIDDPDHYNFMVFDGMSKEEALEKARSISDEVKRSYEKLLRQFKIDNVKILQFRDFEEDPGYIKLLSKFRRLVNKNEELEDDLRKLMINSIGSRLGDHSKAKGHTQTEKDASEKIAFQYILEEVAALLYFTEEKELKIEVDPTKEFTTKKMLYENRIPSVSKALDLGERGHIFVHPEGIEKSTY